MLASEKTMENSKQLRRQALMKQRQQYADLYSKLLQFTNHIYSHVLKLLSTWLNKQILHMILPTNFPPQTRARIKALLFHWREPSCDSTLNPRLKWTHFNFKSIQSLFTVCKNKGERLWCLVENICDLRIEISPIQHF